MLGHHSASAPLQGHAGMIAYASVSKWNKENYAGWDLNAKPSLAFEGIE